MEFEKQWCDGVGPIYGLTRDTQDWPADIRPFAAAVEAAFDAEDKGDIVAFWAMAARNLRAVLTQVQQGGAEVIPVGADFEEVEAFLIPSVEEPGLAALVALDKTWDTSDLWLVQYPDWRAE